MIFKSLQQTLSTALNPNPPREQAILELLLSFCQKKISLEEYQQQARTLKLTSAEQEKAKNQLQAMLASNRPAQPPIAPATSAPSQPRPPASRAAKPQPRQPAPAKGFQHTAKPPSSQPTVPNPLTRGKDVRVIQPLTPLEEELGQRIERTSLDHGNPFTFLPQESARVLRIKRYTFAASSPQTKFSKVESMRLEFAGHAGMNAHANILVAERRLEIHQPLEQEDWHKPEFLDCLRGLAPKPGDPPIIPKNGWWITRGMGMDGTLVRQHGTTYLISGIRGSGKSQQILSNLLELCFLHDPRYLRVVLFDLKNATFSGLENLPWLTQPVCVSAQTYGEYMLNIAALVEDRHTILDGCPSIEVWNASHPPEQALPRIVVFVDEFGRTVHEVGYELANKIPTMIAQYGRSYGIDLVIATQIARKGSKTDGNQQFHADLKGSLTKVAFAVDAGDTVAATQAGYNEAQWLLGMGDGLCRPKRGAITRFQGLYLGEDEGLGLKRDLVEWGQDRYGIPVHLIASPESLRKARDKYSLRKDKKPSNSDDGDYTTISPPPTAFQAEPIDDMWGDSGAAEVLTEILNDRN